MSDAVIPSYRVQRESASLPWRMLAVAGGLIGFLAVAGGGWWAWKSYGGIRAVPVVEADPRPFKVRPDDPGGLRVPNQGELILERPTQRSQAASQIGRNGAMAPVVEAPDLGGLRAAVQDPSRRRICLTYAISIIVAQIGWIIQAVADITVLQSFLCGVPLIAIELLGPVFAERQQGGEEQHQRRHDDRGSRRRVGEQ